MQNLPCHRNLCRASLIAVIALMLVATWSSTLLARSPLRIAVEGSAHIVGQLLTVGIANEGSNSITLCVACCGSIIQSDADPVVPGFDVQVRGPRRWGSLLWGCDVGDCFAPWYLKPGERRNFRIKLTRPGKYRLRLSYVAGEVSPQKGSSNCPVFDSKHRKTSTSESFFVVAKTL